MPTQQETELQAMLIQQQQQIDELKSILNRWKFNGAEDMFGGAGYQRFGGNSMRLDANGMQIRFIEETDTALVFVQEFEPTTALFARPNASFDGFISDDVQSIRFATRGTTASDFANITSRVDRGVNAEAFLDLLVSFTNGEQAGMRLNADADESYVSIYRSPLLLDSHTSDPPSLNDGMVWYRSDLDEFRVRKGGATHTIDTTAV